VIPALEPESDCVYMLNYVETNEPEAMSLRGSRAFPSSDLPNWAAIPTISLGRRNHESCCSVRCQEASVTMRAYSILINSFLLLLTWAVTASAAEKANLPKSITLSYEVIGASTPSVKPLATIFYDPRSLKYSLESWTPPNLDSLKSTGAEPTSSPLLRILLPNGSSTVTGLSTFDFNFKQTIDLWIASEPDGSIFSASVTALTPPPLSAEEEQLQKKIERAKARGKPIPTARNEKPKKKSKDKQIPMVVDDYSQDVKVKVNLIPATVGPTAKLNSRALPQVDAEGNEVPAQDEQQEKSIFQKYWWILLLVAFFTLSGGAGGGDK
jgi:hypothetical protein